MKTGDIIGAKYRLTAQIGEGGMATVWHAIHTTLDQPVAIKFVYPARHQTKEALHERFMREARVAAAIRHRNVVNIIDFGTVDDSAYMVMELLEGESLAERFARVLSATEALAIIDKSLAGLVAVHDAGVVHRDLKAENIFLVYDEDGLFPKLLDFGVSLADESSSHESVMEERAGVVVGTPQYMSPEQAQALPVDQRTDIYSMGILLFETLTGVLPYDGEDPRYVAQLVVEGGAPSLSALRPDLGPVCAVVDRAMSLDPDDRYQTAREMRSALRKATAQLGAMSRATSERRRSSLLPTAAAFTPVDLPRPPRVMTMEANPPTRRMPVWGWAFAAAFLVVAAVVGVVTTSSTEPQTVHASETIETPDIDELAPQYAPRREPDPGEGADAVEVAVAVEGAVEGGDAAEGADAVEGADADAVEVAEVEAEELAPPQEVAPTRMRTTMRSRPRMQQAQMQAEMRAAMAPRTAFSELDF